MKVSQTLDVAESLSPSLYAVRGKQLNQGKSFQMSDDIKHDIDYLNRTNMDKPKYELN